MPNDLAEKLTRALIERDPPHKTSNPEPHIYASEAFSCRRQVFYRLRDTYRHKEYTGERIYPLTQLIALEIGRTFHSIIQEIFSTLYPGFQAEKPWSLGFVSGRADGLYEHNGVAHVLEIKTLSNFSYGRALAANSPAPEHILQAALGAYALKAQYSTLVYLAKTPVPNSTPLLVWSFPLSKESVEAELRELKKVLRAFETSELPDREYQGDIIDRPEKKKFPCGFCQYRERCLVGEVD